MTGIEQGLAAEFRRRVDPSTTGVAKELCDLLDRIVAEHSQVTEPGDHKTKTNPNGSVSQCDRRDLHQPHEYQAEFGAYFNVYCPGNDGIRR